MFSQSLNGYTKVFESLILCLTMKIAVINLLQNNRVTPVTVDQVESEIGGIGAGSLLVKIQDFLTRQHAGSP